MVMLRKQILGLFLSLISTPVLCTDITCPEDYPMVLDSEDVNIKWESVLVLEGQNLVTVVLANKFKGEYLYDVSLTVGESRFDKGGVRQSSPDITTSLRIDQNKRDSSFKFVLGKTELPMKLSILYGEYCGYKIEIGINEFVKSDVPSDRPPD